jgi:signal peptidase
MVAMAAVALPVLPRLLGWQTMIISTGSMEPTYPVGTLTLVQPIDASAVRERMPLVYVSPHSRADTVTHRVVEVVTIDGVNYFRTKGDANDSSDPALVPPEDVVGLVTYAIPYLGWAVNRLQGNPILFVGLIAIPALLTVAGEVRNIRRSLQSRREPAVDDSVLDLS